MLPWALTGAAVLVQIVFPLVPDGLRAGITVGSVLVFCAATLSDVGRVHGVRGVAVLLVVAGGGGLLVEAAGVHTGVPFGAYAYTGDLGPQVLSVPVVVPLAWTMMAWPALVVGRTLARRWPVAVVGGVALAAWDLFLDPQMVDAGHWTWAHPEPALPLVPGVPLTNYAGWLVVAVVIVGALHGLLPAQRRPSGPASALYLWAYGSSVAAHVLFFDRPGSAVVGGLVMGVVAVPFAVVLWTDRRGQSA
jgi:putative membrane protein